MGERVTHVLDAGQSVFEFPASPGEFWSDARVNSQCFQRGLFELLSCKELRQGRDELLGVDLTAAEPMRW